MAGLEIFDPRVHLVLARSQLTAVKAVRLYYVFAGRNAWHSTWIQRYRPGCMHLSLQSAKKHAEAQRVQGSVFNILELPAVAGISSAGAMIVTQINEDRPLGSYSPHALSETHPSAKLIDGPKDNYLVDDAPLLGFALSFARDSRFWRSLPPRENSVFELACRDAAAEFEELDHSEPARYTSMSNGSKYYLGWVKANGKIRFEGTEVFDHVMRSKETVVAPDESDLALT